MKIRGCFVLGVSVCCSHAPLVAQQRPVSASEFAAQAHAALPLEEPFAFHKALTEREEPMRRDLAAVPSAQEFALPPNGWSVQFASNSREIVRTAVREFQNYLRRSMQVQTELKEEPSLEGWRGARRAIVVGTREQLPGCGTGLTRSKDYRVVVSPERVVICGFDEAGAMHGLYHLEARMNLREAPFLPIELDTVRHSLFQARLTLSGLGRDEYPDRYLALLSRYGFDSIYASPYANPNGVSGPQIYARWSKQDPTQVHDLIRRAARYGIRIYCPILYPIAGEPESEAGLRKLVRDIVTEFPEIRGYILLTEGFLYNVDLGTKARGSLDDQRDWLARWSQGIAIAAEEAHRINPAIEILPWDYNMDYREAMLDVKRYGTGQLPVESIPLLTFENGKGFTRDGERGYLKDYSINEAGPSEVTAAPIEVAKQRGMRAVYSKADTWASWQFGTFPYLPVPYQWYSRYQALEQQGIDGTHVLVTNGNRTISARRT